MEACSKVHMLCTELQHRCCLPKDPQLMTQFTSTIPRLKRLFLKTAGWYRLLSDTRWEKKMRGIDIDCIWKLKSPGLQIKIWDKSRDFKTHWTNLIFRTNWRLNGKVSSGYRGKRCFCVGLKLLAVFTLTTLVVTFVTGGFITELFVAMRPHQRGGCQQPSIMLKLTSLKVKTL